MPRPTYEQPQRQTGRQRRFADLAQVLQLQEGLQAPQREQRALDQRSDNNTLQAALAALGLQQQADQNAATLQLGKDQMAATQGAAGDRSFVDAAQIASQPNVPPGVMEALKLRFPQLATGAQTAQAADTARGVGVLEPQVKAVYGSGVAPGKMGPMLDALKMSNPAAFEALPWDQLNALIPGAAPEGSGIIQGIVNEREGGIGTPVAKAASEYIDRNFPGPEQRAKNRAINEADPLNPFNLLFGKKKKPQPSK